MHIVLVLDTTQATAGDRIKLYVNGSQVTAFSTSANPSQNADLGINQAAVHGIGAATTPTGYLSGYLADVHFIDGQALTPSSFTEVSATTGQLIPKAYTGTFTGNSFWLKFADNSAATATTLGKDSSGLGNNWTPNNLSVTAGAGNDSLVDVPTNGSEVDTGLGGQVRGNYCTLNPLIVGAATTLSDGNLQAFFTGWNSALGTIAFPRTGKWYYEVNVATNESLIGIVSATSVLQNAVGTYFTASVTSYGYYSGASKNSGPGNSSSSYGASFTTGDIIGVAFDADAGSLTFYKNGVSQGTAFTGVAGDYLPAMGSSNASGQTLRPNFGQRPFAYTAPSGFKALCTANLPAPVVTKPSTVMDVKLYTGNGSTQTISGLGFSPDLVWIKNRSGANNHILTDTVRGATKNLYSNLTSIEETYTNALSAFTSDGFSVGNLAGVNTSGGSLTAWCWDAGSSTVTDNTGSIQSTRRTNATAGISIVSWSASGTSSTQTVGHGLGVTPQFIITKSRTTAGYNWNVYHPALASGYNLFLQLTNAAEAAPLHGWLGAPTSSVITLTKGSSSNTNVNIGDMIAYCFAPVAGYSSFGSYTGNGSADGPFVYTGHRSRWLLVKCSSTTGAWILHDTARTGYNVMGNELRPDDSTGEYSADRFDIVSNGFKVRSSNSTLNSSGATYIYCSFAESPFQYARAR